MQERFKLKRDYYAGGLMLLLGVGAAVIGSGYKFGSLARMGPGFMPVMLGIVLAFLGVLIAGTGGIPKVSGSRMEMVATGPIPGSTPTRLPTSTPRKQYIRLCGSSATPKP